MNAISIKATKIAFPKNFAPPPPHFCPQHVSTHLLLLPSSKLRMASLAWLISCCFWERKSVPALVLVAFQNPILPKITVQKFPLLWGEGNFYFVQRNRNVQKFNHLYSF